MKTLILALILISSTSQASWFCTEEATIANTHEIDSCGVAYNKTEDEARQVALEGAILEYKTICSLSSYCKDHAVDALPARTECFPFKKGYKCYRLVKFMIHP